MLKIHNSRKADKDLYNTSSEDFIPIACHYDENTLLSKNGELLQTIQINGINSEHISEKLFNLREIVRDAIKNNVNGHDFSFWIHTIRSKTNLDDPTPYNKLLPANIHNVWCKKNYWDDKYVNTLYITIIHASAELKTKNLNALINSLFFKIVSDFQEKYLTTSYQKLNSVVDKILNNLQEFGAIKLGVRFDKENTYSDLLFLYHRIIHLNEDSNLIPISDLSTYLASQQYAVGGDKIEVMTDHGRKFAAMLSLKEYQEVSSESLDMFLQLPIELIATEIFYFVDKKNVVSMFEDQDYILKVSGDSALREIKGMTKILAEDSKIKYCRRQISISIIGDTIDKLERDIEHASIELSKIGIVHVREDINLEQTFWAQLPGNFTFLRRMGPTIIDEIAALTLLHNFPTGNQYNPWGRAITLLRTEKGTPYFMNFHDKENNGSLCIFGSNRTGKTTLTNFLISESMKFNPTLIYLSNGNSSKIFIEALEGKWHEEIKGIINPFLCEQNDKNVEFINEFLKIICDHYNKPLTEQEEKFLQELTIKIFSLDVQSRNLTNILKTLDFTSEAGILINAKLSMFNENGLYKQIFDLSTPLQLEEGDVIGCNLYQFTEEYFTKHFFPQDKKLIEQFNNDLKVLTNIRIALIYAFSHYLNLSGTNPKILALDNIDTLIIPNNFKDVVINIFTKITKNNGSVISNFNLIKLQLLESSIIDNWIALINTNIILPSDLKIDNLNKIFNLTKSERDKLKSLTISSRMFLIKQKDLSIVAELSIGGLPGIIRILSSGPDELAIYQRILQESPGPPDNWINPLYMALQ